MKSNSNYLKVPCEMAQFALSMKRREGYRIVGTYLACQFLFNGQAEIEAESYNKVAMLTDNKKRTIYKHIRWLFDRDWIGKDKKQGWLYTRSFRHIHTLEGWQFARAVIMYPKDLKTLKGFFAGGVLASLAESEIGQRTDRTRGRSKQAAAPISISALQKVLNVSRATAYRLRKEAHDQQYIINHENLVQICNLTPEDLKSIRANDIQKIKVELLGYADRRIVSTDRIRYRGSKLYLQDPNLVLPLLKLKGRKGFSNYDP